VNLDLDKAKRDEQALRVALEAAGAVFHGKATRCPFHEDAHASAGVYADEDGFWRFRCHGCGFGGDLFDVKAKVQGIPIEQALRDFSDGQKPKYQAPPEVPLRAWTLAELRARYPGEDYAYTNPDTRQADMRVFRFEEPTGKTFRIARPEGDGLVLKRPEGLLPLYNRLRIRATDTILVVEGEKCVHAAQAGFPGARPQVAATTSAMGAGKAAYSDWSPLKGKTCALWPDLDEPGHSHMREVAEILRPIAASVRIIDPSGLDLPSKGDVADYLDLNRAEKPADKAQLILDVMADAEGADGASKLRKRYEAIWSGEYVCIPWPWRGVDYHTRALLPAKLTILCGPPGSMKSWMLLEAMLYWHKQGKVVCMYALEDDAEDHLQRAIAQLAGDSRMMSPEWAADNRDIAEAVLREHEPVLRDFSKRLCVLPEGEPTLDDLAEWVEARVADGAEVIGIDPITAADAGRDRFIADRRFVLRVKQAIRKTGARLILVTHPKQDNSARGMNGMAGGAAYQRFPHTVLWLQAIEAEEMLVEGKCGRSRETVNAVLTILKARNAPGSGRKLGMFFESASVRFQSRGLLVKETK